AIVRPAGWEEARLRALLSVANRDGIAALARELRALDVEIVATDGTREHLAAEGVEVGSVSDLTQVPPLAGGQVKTFHPARNAAGVAAVADPAHYPVITEELHRLGHISPELRARLAAEAFSTVAAYYAEIAAYLNQIVGNVFPSRFAMVLEKVDELRYGEN